MRALAEYVMKGRSQAVIAVVLATGTVLFAWVGAAVIALVTLRRGVAQGGYLLFWGLIPATALAAWGDTTPLTTLLGVAAVASVLRTTASWSWTLMAAVFSGVVTAYLMLTVGSGYIDLMLQLLGDAFADIGKQPDLLAHKELSEGVVQSAQVLKPTTGIPLPTAQQIAGLLGLSNAFTIIMCLVLARWWQALLFNPGGFQTEFHRLRLSPQSTMILLALGILVSLMGPDYTFWAIIFAVPFIFSGFALIHGLAAQKQIKNSWFVLLYCGWLVLEPVRALLLILAVADSWLDIRKRFASGRPDNDHDS